MFLRDYSNDLQVESFERLSLDYLIFEAMCLPNFKFVKE